MHLDPFWGVKIALKMFLKQILPEWYLFLCSHVNQKSRRFLGHCSPSAPLYYIRHQVFQNISWIHGFLPLPFITLVSKPLSLPDSTFVSCLTHQHSLALTPEAKGKLHFWSLQHTRSQNEIHKNPPVAFHCFWDHDNSTSLSPWVSRALANSHIISAPGTLAFWFCKPVSSVLWGLCTSCCPV